MNQFKLAITIGLTIAFSVISFTETCANDFRSLLAERNLSRQTNNSRDAASLQAPIVARQMRSKESMTSARSAIEQMNAKSNTVRASSVGHLLGGHRHVDSGCDCGACDACDAMPIPRKRLRMPKLGCRIGCGSGCGEIIDASCGCDQGCRLGLLKKHCHDEQQVCMPRTEVNLPSSTLRQYFRSDRCSTNIWDGYSRQCSPNHKHVHGTCDCGTKKKCRCLSGLCGGTCGEVLPPRQACNDCDSCDASCDSGCCH